LIAVEQFDVPSVGTLYGDAVQSISVVRVGMPFLTPTLPSHVTARSEGIVYPNTTVGIKKANM